MQVITEFKRRTRHFKHQQQLQQLSSPLTFFPLAAAFDIMTVPLADALPALPPGAAPPGFLGYAVHLIRLRREDEYLRHSLYYTIFKNLMVFDTTQHLRDYSHAVGGGREPYACALDYYDHQQQSEPASAAHEDPSCVFPRFAHAAPREYPYRDPGSCAALLDAQVAACVTSLAHIRYGL